MIELGSWIEIAEMRYKKIFSLGKISSLRSLHYLNASSDGLTGVKHQLERKIQIEVTLNDMMTCD